MTKDIVKNGDVYWFDGDGNSIVIAENGGVYFVDKNDRARYLTDDIRKIYDEKPRIILLTVWILTSIYGRLTSLR